MQESPLHAPAEQQVLLGDVQQQHAAQLGDHVEAARIIGVIQRTRDHCDKPPQARPLEVELGDGERCALRESAHRTLLTTQEVVELEGELGELQTREHVIAAAQKLRETSELVVELFMVLVHVHLRCKRRAARAAATMHRAAPAVLGAIRSITPCSNRCSASPRTSRPISSPAERYRRLLVVARGIVRCDSVALLRLDDGAFVPIAVDGLRGEALGRRYPPEHHPRLARIATARGAIRFDDTDLADPFDGLFAAAGDRCRVHMRAWAVR